MKEILKFLVNYQMKINPGQHQAFPGKTKECKGRLWGLRMKRKKRKTYSFGGFTLIELLVALVISSIIISSLLGFMVNILTTDRREQAKTNSELEIQSAINYIARDLRQAVYIYDADALATNHSKTSNSGIRDQIPPVKTTTGCSDLNICRPVLVFWKRELMKDAIPVSGGADDTFVYSLVGYYLIKDKDDVDSDTWSEAARIARFQIKDGVKDNDGAYITDPDDGFAAFDISGADTLREKMNRWEKDSMKPYDNPVQVLVDYIDHSNDATKIPAPNKNIPGGGGSPPTTYPASSEYAKFCENILPTNYTNESGIISYQAQLVPNYNADSFPDELKTGSFYACVDSLSTQAKIFIRGNALARFNPNNAEYEESRSQFFPTTSLRVQGRGILGE